MPIYFLFALPFAALIALIIWAYVGQQRKERELPKEIVKARRKKSELEGWRLFGSILLLSSLGLSIRPMASFAEFPWWIRFLVSLFGIVMIVVANKKIEKVEAQLSPKN